MAKQKRTAVPGHPGICRYEQSGLYEVRRHTFIKSPRFTTLKDAIAWRDQTAGQPPPAATFAEAFTPAPGTLASYETWYWEQIPQRPGKAAEQSSLKAWFREVVTLPTGETRTLGKMPVREVSADLVNGISARWLSVPRSGGRKIPATSRSKAYPRSTVKKRLEALRHYCEHLAKHKVPGLVAPTTDAYALLPRRQKTPPITVPLPVVVAVLQKLLTLDRKTHARFAVVAATGQRPCQVGRAILDDIDL
jgi:integrase